MQRMSGLQVRALTSAALIGLICNISSAAWADWVGSGWERTDQLSSYSSGSPGYAGTDPFAPFVYAYQGQVNAFAHAEAAYEQYWELEGSGSQYDSLKTDSRVIGTIGFFENPTGHTYSSAANSNTDSGPPDYDTPETLFYNVSGTSEYRQCELSADVTNYGHSSAQFDADIGIWAVMHTNPDAIWGFSLTPFYQLW
jgi:hypothetical protein